MNVPSLRRVPSIKVKFSLVIVAAIGVAVIMSQVGYALGWPLWLRPTIAVFVSLGFVQLLAHGMTKPLRHMALAAKEISRGDYEQRIETLSVDEVGQLAVAFNAMASELRDADRQRRELIANVSHELRTPVAGIRAALENLIDGVIEPSPELMAMLHGRINRLQRLVEALLDLSRLESGTVDLKLESLVLAEVVRGAVDETRFDNPSVHISCDLDDSLRVRGDAERLHQVVANLLENAVRHGGAPISATIRSSTVGVTLTIDDCGDGFQAGESDRVFDRFFRGVNGHASPGTGLGLAIVKWIVELHGGTITAAENQPRGARLTVTLPLIGDSAPPQPRTNEPTT